MQNKPDQPYLDFLDAVDQKMNTPIELHCLGGFVVSQFYGMLRNTQDVDVLSILPWDASTLLQTLAGQGSDLYLKYKLYIELVAVTAYPENYEERSQPMFPHCWQWLQLKALDPHDLALTKLERNSIRDRADVRYLAITGKIHKETLRRLYYDEYRIYTTGRVESHDLTLKLWLEEFWS